jgi:hypothetical protein
MRNAASTWLRAWRAAALLVPALLALPAAATAADLYKVLGVPVDATAPSAVEARRIAIDSGEREGLSRLMRRLTSPDDHPTLPPVERLTVDRFVNSFEIAQEKVGPTRYLATLNISYVAAAVQSLLRGAGIPYVTRRSDPILVVPVEAAAPEEAPAAWLESSPWQAAWDEGVGRTMVTVLALPLGDLADIAAAPPAAVAAGDEAALDALASRYGSRSVVVASARLERAPDTGQLTRIAVSARRADAWKDPLLDSVVEVAPDEAEPAALARAVDLVIAAIESDWKRQTLVRAAPVSLLSTALPLADLASWVQIRRELTGLPEVRSVQVDSFGQTEARLTIGYEGDLAQLAAAVGRVGLALVQENDGWHLRPAGGPADYPAPSPVLPASP